jgi:hypothetical protein
MTTGSFSPLACAHHSLPTYVQLLRKGGVGDWTLFGNKFGQSFQTQLYWAATPFGHLSRVKRGPRSLPVKYFSHRLNQLPQYSSCVASVRE